MSTRIATALATAALALAAVVGGCGGGGEAGGAGDIDTALQGDIVVDGSSTVAPLTKAAAAAFVEEHPLVSVDVRTSGTGGGFKVFCAGQTDLSDASRRISADEAAKCAANGVDYEAFRVASDGITVVTRKGAEVGDDCLTLDELKRVWIKGSTIGNWRAINPRFGDRPLTLAGPGSDSGTYDFFNERVLGEGPDGETREARRDYTASEDDNVIVKAVEAADAGMGYFGYSYYARNEEGLQPLRLDAQKGEGCVGPSLDTINRGDYPLARPLFVYASRASLKRREVREFLRFYLENAERFAGEAQVPPAPRAALDDALLRLRRE